MNKLPSEIRLIVSRETTAGKWDLDGVMKILEREVEARERASAVSYIPPTIVLPTHTTGLSVVFSLHEGYVDILGEIWLIIPFPCTF